MRSLLFILCFPLVGRCQNTIALPHVINYSKEAYSGGLQNWKVRQDKSGIIYVANNEGLLSFDGSFWHMYPLPNKTIVRSLEVAEGRIYAGGQDELGYFEPDKDGRLSYRSLTEKLPASARNFGDVWEIVSFDQAMFFRCSNVIIRYAGGELNIFRSESEWQFLGKCHGALYASAANSGLVVWSKGLWTNVVMGAALPPHDPVTGILPLTNGAALVTTLKSGVFRLHESQVTPLTGSDEGAIKSARIYAVTPLSADRIALATSNRGIFIIDTAGTIVQSISSGEGLQNNNVLSVFSDKDGNIWLGLDNGIDFIAYNGAIKQINPLMQNSSGYAALVHGNQLYIGTANGLYHTSLQPSKDLSFSRGRFEPVSNTNGQTWSLAEIGGNLLLGHHEGAFEIKNDIAYPLAATSGFWNFQPFGVPAAQSVLAGTYYGLQFFNTADGKTVPAATIPRFTESSRYIVTDTDNTIWVSHPYHGIYKITPAPGDRFTVQKFTEREGLPALLNNHIFKIKNKIVAATIKGVYELNDSKTRFIPSEFYKAILGEQSIRYLKESPAGNIWFIHDKELGVVDLSGKKPQLLPLPALNNKILSGFEFIYPLNESNIFLSGEKGFYHINYEKFKKNIAVLYPQVRSVRIIGDKDSLLFGGYFAGVDAAQVQAGKAPALSHDWKSIRFEFSAISFGNQTDVEYAYRLAGYDEKWSDWAKRTDKEYTNLNAGTYSFDVKVRSGNRESAAGHYRFEILAPWYLTRFAYVVYFVLILTGLYLSYLRLKKKFRMQRQKYEEEQQKLLYIHRLEQNEIKSELVTLQNEKLEADISFKNAELAASAMNLVKKGELLTKIKKDLSHISKDVRNPEALTVINKMLKTVGEDDRLDKEWEQFAKHFDSVHSDFVVNLKEKHPALTGTELKLCANIRMNLSTKEIAQLMNISVRGVEIGRYRLRKKLAIGTGANLFDYLMGI